MSRKSRPAELISTARRCDCGTRLIDGTDEAGTPVIADARYVDAASELLAWASGRDSFELDYQLGPPHGLTLTRRHLRDIKRRPADRNKRRIVLTHACTKGDNTR